MFLLPVGEYILNNLHQLKKKKVLILSSSLFTNRLLPKSLFEHLGANVELFFWGASRPIFLKSCKYESFPIVFNNRELINFLRRINEFAWVKGKDLVSIESMKRFNKSSNHHHKRDTAIHFLGSLIAFLRLHNIMDAFVRTIVARQKRSPEAMKRLLQLKPDVVVVTNPFWIHESSVAIEAKSLGIKLISIVPSWDNITTKSRLTFDSDAYFVWSDVRVKELQRIYPKTLGKRIYTYGTPQYEVFFNTEFHQSRQEFCKAQGLDPDRKIILYTTGSPNFIKTEYDAAAVFQKYFANDPALNQNQLFFRPHPNKDNNELQHLHKPEEHCFVQFTPQAGLKTEERNLNKESTFLWVNTFRHADVVVNLSSTVTLDAILCGKPVINLNFDMSGDANYDVFIKEINSSWTHLKDVWECKGIPQVNSISELKAAILIALSSPEEGRKERDELFKKICGEPDEFIGKRFAAQILDCAKNLEGPWK